MAPRPVSHWCICAAVALAPHSLEAQDPGRREAGRQLPMSAAILRAHAAGTRDSTGRPGPLYWQLRTHYSIDARLDPTSSTVAGHGIIVLHNTSPMPLATIQVRLDQNRFRRGSSADVAAPNPTEGMVVTRLTVDGQSAAIGPRAPSDTPVLSGTGMTSERITLVRPVSSGDSLVLEVDWHFEVPLDDAGTGLRLGRWGNDLYQVAQWYPRIAMFDDLHGWDTTSHTGNAEFYNPYGRFDVRLDVPAGWLVGSTGVLVNAEEVLTPRTRERLARVLESDSVITVVGHDDRGAGRATLGGDRLVWRFVADSVSDFAWGASERYLWKATRVQVPGRDPIPAHVLYTSANAGNFESAGAQLRHDLAFNSDLIMPYAHPQHTLLDGPEGGMEYPMLTMSNGRALTHELWHQWFPIMVGSNETWYSFMDEGFATFLAGETAAARSGRARSVPATRGGRTAAPLIWPDDRGPPHLFAGVYGYGKPAEMFAALGEMVGHRAVLDALREYAIAWRFKHPSPWDFMLMMNGSLERDLSEFWYVWLFTAGE